MNPGVKYFPKIIYTQNKHSLSDVVAGKKKKKEGISVIVLSKFICPWPTKTAQTVTKFTLILLVSFKKKRLDAQIDVSAASFI